MIDAIKNAAGKIYYGMHFYPGVAEYSEPGKDPYRVFLNEDTIRKMDPSFAGRPIFVEHVEDVEENINKLRAEADGWVVESFYNSADGKHWVKFIVVSDEGERAIRNGFRLSNAYVPKSFGNGGLWNGVSYSKEVTDGQYEHLAIVRNPRYEESVIMSPEEFKAYNEEKQVELKRLANSKDEKGEPTMKLNLFKRTKVENSADLEGMSVILPESKKEMTISQLVADHDKIVNMHGYASGDHMVKVGENEMSVNDLVKKHMELNDELEAMKSKKEDAVEEEGDLEAKDKDVDVESDKKNEDDEDADDKDKKENDGDGDGTLGTAIGYPNEKDKKKNAADKKVAELEAKKKAKEKADRLRIANDRAAADEGVKVEFSADQVERGKSRYGS